MKPGYHLRLQHRKMSNRTTRDRISALPDHLLLHILSFMDDMKEVQTTTILSKRWQYVWTSAKTLTFRHGYDDIDDDDDFDMLEETRKFVTWVNRTLLGCRNASIEKIHVTFVFNRCFTSDVDAWFRFASEKEVKELSLIYLNSETGDNEGYYHSLPNSLCSNSFLMKLWVDGCKFIPKRGLSWARLKSLSLSFVKLNEDAITNILLGSPMLEYLQFFACTGTDHLNINSESLRKLVIDDSNDDLGDESFLEISAPNLQSLYVLGSYCKLQFRMMRVPSILQVKLMFSVYIKDEVDRIIEFLESLRHVRELELARCCWCMEVLAQLLVEGKTLSSPFTALTCLKVNAFIDKQVATGILSLLKCSPNLEKLVITRSRLCIQSPCSKQVEEYWESRRMIEKFSLPRLKTVEFHGFTKLEDPGELLELVQVLENAGYFCICFHT